MLRRPDVDEVMEYGRVLGFDLTPLEARMIQARMMDTIAALEAFDEMRVEERRPPHRITDRDPGPRNSARRQTAISLDLREERADCQRVGASERRKPQPLLICE